MTDINVLLTDFNTIKETLTTLYNLECTCISRSCSKLFCIDAPLTIDMINNFVQTQVSECQRCQDIKSNLGTFETLKIQISQYVEEQITPTTTQAPETTQPQ